MKEVRWTETAKQTLIETSNFIRDLWNVQIQENFLDQLEYRIKQLQQNPELGPAFEQTDFRKLTIHKSVSLFYINKRDFIKLLVIWDNRSDPDQLFKKLTEASRN
ncbi:type II toxin-antitoxin system RelE/ParE family toxin [Reichenbachiella ulvae]|uniref:Type II toxin-antitoxin system RelE/ParE family toxin n=1 Tax=Reichenbachiella ulvae TaxID=2980104 RepID=A0ABT3CN66_9BACT|nr:type II toxin-antitoxin system RelE/ParE family toxin [Reichenbachiella ulvae]MCV9385101.1 type II toxin-antitoxin system RelE/ParE family toxin [Reichenbachiella ulvae]